MLCIYFGVGGGGVTYLCMHESAGVGGVRDGGCISVCRHACVCVHASVLMCV